MPRRPSRRTVERRYRARSEELEAAYRRAALELFGTEREDVVKIVRRAMKRGGIPTVEASLRAIQRAYTDEQGTYHVRWLERFGELNRNAIRIAGQELKVATGMDFLLPNRIAQRAARERAAGLAEFIGETSAERVTTVVHAAMEEGGAVADIVKVLRDGAFGEDISLARAERIARTEVGGSLNTGQYEQATESGIFSQKEWLHSGNTNAPRDWHVAMDGERVSIEDVFSNGLHHPGEQGAPPEEVINCGCTMLYHV